MMMRCADESNLAHGCADELGCADECFAPTTSCMPWRLRYQLARNWAHPVGPRPTLHGLHPEEDPEQATADGRPTDKDSQGGRSAGEEHKRKRVGQGSTSPSSVLAQLGLAVAAGAMAGGKGGCRRPSGMGS